MIKSQHELRIEGNALGHLAELPLANSEVDAIAVINFAREWAEFLPFYSYFHLLVDSAEQTRTPLTDPCLMVQAKEWHRRRDKLKELLFHAGEQNVALHRIPSWERLKAESQYIGNNAYITPFSFILDFTNPIYMIANHGSDLWQSSFISQEFMDYLSYRFPEIKQFWASN